MRTIVTKKISCEQEWRLHKLVNVWNKVVSKISSAETLQCPGFCCAAKASRRPQFFVWNIIVLMVSLYSYYIRRIIVIRAIIYNGMFTILSMDGTSNRLGYWDIEHCLHNFMHYTLWGIKTHQNVFCHNFRKSWQILNKFDRLLLKWIFHKAVQTNVTWTEYQLCTICWNLKVSKVTNTTVT